MDIKFTVVEPSFPDTIDIRLPNDRDPIAVPVGKLTEKEAMAYAALLQAAFLTFWERKRNHKQRRETIIEVPRDEVDDPFPF